VTVTDLGVDERRALRELRTELTRFMMSYKFATDEMMTKINILKEEFSSIHDYSPIEHVRSRLKSPEGILKKARRTAVLSRSTRSAIASRTSPASGSPAASSPTRIGSRTC